MEPNTVTWLLASFLAVVPEIPTVPTPTDDECTQAVPLVMGETPPEDLIEPDLWTVNCGAVAIPTSQAAYALEMIHYGQAMDRLYSDGGSVRADGFGWLEGAAIGLGIGILTGVYIGKN